jgi:hypothetical protein
MTRCTFVNVFVRIVSAYYRVKDKNGAMDLRADWVESRYVSKLEEEESPHER